MKEIKTIKNEITNTDIVEKSKFIAFLFPMCSKEAAENKLEEIRKKYIDSTHVCYAYVINEDVMLYKSSDDGEPSGTAGSPMLNVLQRNKLENVLLVVVRYFGGIKLGAGGLTRAYSNASISVCEKASIITLVDAYNYQITFDYNNTKDIDELIRINKLEVIKKNYDEKISYILTLKNEEEINKIKDKSTYYKYEYEFIEIVKIEKK